VRRPTWRRKLDQSSDEGSALIICLFLMAVAGFFILPVMTYTMTVLKSNVVVRDKATRSEAVRGGLRVALSDPTKLYAACKGAGPTVAVDLAAPPSLNTNLPSLSTQCFKVKDQSQFGTDLQRWALTTTQTGSQLVIPVADPIDGTINTSWCTSKLDTPPVPCGKSYPDNGSATTNAWWQPGVASSTSTANQIFVPFLPANDRDLQPATGFNMPSWNPGGACNVFFPGTYPDDVTISGPTKAYFVSGIYYFEKTLRITGGATVVVGTGATPGCVDSDSTAAFYAEVSPGVYPNKNQLDGASGVGGTFVFGDNGRLVIDDTASGSAINFTMNRRVQQVGKPEEVMNDVSILSVNGVSPGAATTTTDLDIPLQLSVPASKVLGTTSEPREHGYVASLLVSTLTPPVSCAPPAAFAVTCPIVDIKFGTTRTVNVKIPGYVAVPQGSLSLVTATGMGTGKSITFGGGLLTAQIAVSPVLPSYLQMGVLNPIVQKTFKIVTTTTSGIPKLTATSLVQVNETGGYSINSMVVQQG
jgi:hypothetical protein